MRAEVPLERGMAREAGLEPAASVLETDSVATSLTPSYFDYRISKINKMTVSLLDDPVLRLKHGAGGRN